VRVVFDSNIYVSALALPGGRADAAVLALLAGRATAMISEPILGEVLRVLGRKFGHDREQLARVAIFLSELAEPVDSRRRIHALADEPDNRILECAVAARADLIVTGDRAMLRLGSFEGVQIVSLRDFLDLVGK
jgi:putative PIN family toxin of toxin-antitoxin system